MTRAVRESSGAIRGYSSRSPRAWGLLDLGWVCTNCAGRAARGSVASAAIPLPDGSGTSRLFGDVVGSEHPYHLRERSGADGGDLHDVTGSWGFEHGSVPEVERDVCAAAGTPEQHVAAFHL